MKRFFKTTGRPSAEKRVHWIYAFRRQRRYPRSTPRSGKWLIFVYKKNVDVVWEKIRRATEEGNLGDTAKVATSKPNPHRKPGLRVICVYTYDWKDVVDVKRVREELRKIGIIQPISYKSDQDTLQGKYAGEGRKRISKYYE